MHDANGTPNGPRATNGVHGAPKSPLNGHAVGPRTTPRPRRPGMLARTFNIAARLLTWYSILSILFRCPPTLDACDDASPRICRPYFQLRDAVAPHVEPYYDTYAAPYVDLARPYYSTVDQKVIAPAWGYAKHYGAPRVQQVQALGKAQWEKSVQPQVDRYQSLARAQYDEKLAPHIAHVSTALGPYCEMARTHGLQTYHELLVPAYQYVQPHLLQGYRATSAFASDTAVPAFAWTWTKTYAFIDGTVGPQIRAVYVENVEPQLIKIGKRLGRYSTTGKKSVPKPLTTTTSASTGTSSSFTKPAASVSATSSSAAASSSAPTSTHTEKKTADRSRASMEPIPPPEIDEKLEQTDPARRETREIVAADLRDWQERYAKAADEGAAEIDERVQDIAKRMIRRNARVTGKALLEQLQTAAVSELASLREAIIEVVGAVNDDGATPEEGQEQIVQAVRRAGLAVREKAKAVRTWREQYESEMRASVTTAAETHFSILENIRDLALQKIGMKWAWMDGVTYKDWAKYHLLKSRFDEWKGDLEKHVVSHPSLEAAQLEAAHVEDEAMGVAAAAAKELARLKQVAHWKLAAADETPEFDSTLMQQAAEAVEAAKLAAEAVDDAASEARNSAVEGVGEGVSRASDAASRGAEAVDNFAKEARDAVVGGSSEDVAQASEAVSKAADAVGGHEDATEVETSDPSSEPAVEASHVLEDSQTSPTEVADAEEAEPVVEAGEATEAEAASEELSSVEPASEPTDDTPGVASSVLFETPVMVGNFTEQAADKAAPELPDEPEDDQEDDEHADEPEPLPVSTASVRPALFGAAAQSVPSRRPILDDDTLDDVPAAMESMRGDLESAYSAAISRANEQYSQALSIVSAQLRGTPGPAHEQLIASVTSAYSNAMATASARLHDALKGASDPPYGSTTKTGVLPTAVPGPEWSQIESIAAERLQQGRAWAEEQYESAKVAIGVATPAPSTPAEHASRMLDNARHNYYAGLGLAHARYSEFLAAASSAMGATPTPTDVAGSASSMASVVSEGVSSVASAAGDSAASAASGASEGASSVLSAAGAGASSVASVGSENASAAAAAGYDTAAAAGEQVAERWDAVVSKISQQVYGAPTPTPWYSNMYSAVGEYASSASFAAGEYASSATSAAGESGASVTSAAGVYASAGSEQIAQQYSAASSIVSEALVGKEPSFSESVISRLSAAYATGASAASQASGAVKSAGDQAASAASDATEAVKDTASSIKDEL